MGRKKRLSTNPVESFKNNVEACDGITFKEAIQTICTGGGVAFTYSWKDMVKAFTSDPASSSQPDSTSEQSESKSTRPKS